MTIYEFITNETGKKHLIPGQDPIYTGQCVQLIGIYTKEMFNQDLPAHPNAKDYWTYGIPGWDKVDTPEEGDIAVYDGHTGFPEGHIAIYYAGGTVFEENADPDGSPAHLYNRSNTYLLGYLRRQGEEMLNEGDIINLWHIKLPNSNPPADYIKVWTGKSFKDLFYDLSNNVPEWYGAGQPAATVLTPGVYKVN